VSEENNCCCDCDCGEEFTPLEIGESVPDFTIDVYNPTKKDFGTLSFADIKAAGKWTILVFYPGDFTFVCTTELTALAEQYNRFKAMGAEIISVSCDTKHVHLAWQRDEDHLHSVTYPMGADPSGELAELFGVYVADQGYARRGTFIIDPTGQLVVKEVHIDWLGRNMDELMRRFKACLLISKHPDKACPSKWKDEGDATLTPGANLVGNVSKTYDEHKKEK